MLRQRLLFVGLVLGAFGVVAASQEVDAGDYIWARSGWGNGNWGRNYGGMTNGYGGYYVPRNAYGNNYEGRPITNPNGYIVPATTSTPSPSYHMTRHWFH